MHAVRHHLQRATLFQRIGGGAQGASGIYDVIHQHAGLARHITNDVHHGGHVSLRAALVDDGQFCIVKALGNRARAHHTAHVRRHHNHIVGAMRAPDIGQQQRRGIDIVHRYIEEPLNLIGMQIHGEHAVGIHRTEHFGRHFGGDRHTRRARAAVLASITKIRHHRCHTGRRCAFERVDQHQQFHEIFSRRRIGRLDDVHLLPAHAFFNLNLYFAIGKAADEGFARPHA